LGKCLVKEKLLTTILLKLCNIIKRYSSVFNEKGVLLSGEGDLVDEKALNILVYTKALPKGRALKYLYCN
jgi:hypothetical protein